MVKCGGRLGSLEGFGMGEWQLSENRLAWGGGDVAVSLQAL